MVSALSQISRNSATTLELSSSKGVLDVLCELRCFFNRKRWIGNNNRYRVNCLKTLNDDINAGNIDNKHLREYIVASIFLHCADGWTYLGRALDSHARGNTNISRHLAYYAELRSAMAILAAEGIGVFHPKHFIINSNSECKRIPRKYQTHKFVWLAFEHWASLQRSADLIGVIISPYGIGLDVWVQSFAGSFNITHVGSEWLKSWGLDIRVCSEDREARNESSYTPNRLNRVPNLGVNRCSDFLCEFWGIFEPDIVSRFKDLDMYLLRRCMESIYRGVHGSLRSGSYKDRIRTTVDDVLPIPSSRFRGEVVDFLLRVTDSSDPVVLSEAFNNTKTTNPKHHIQVISRAALLLRVATGICDKLITEANYNRSDLSFWWEEFGIDRGLWDSASAPNNFIDLWDDVDEAVNDIQGGMGNQGAAYFSYASWWSERAKAISQLGRCERIILWGFGI